MLLKLWMFAVLDSRDFIANFGAVDEASGIHASNSGIVPI
jgi:hypothetical protein